MKLHADNNTRTEAELVYRTIMRLDPKHADALHMLGALLTQLHGEDSVRDEERAWLKLSVRPSPALTNPFPAV